MKLNKEQIDLVNQSTILCSKILLHTISINSIPNFIETIIVDDTTGLRYKLRFEKLK